MLLIFSIIILCIIFIIAWTARGDQVSNGHNVDEIHTVANSLFEYTCNLLQNNKSYEELLNKITPCNNPGSYIHKNDSLIWVDEAFPDLSFNAEKKFNQDDYSLYVYSNSNSRTKKYFGFSLYLDSPECANEQSKILVNSWIIQVVDSVFGCKAKKQAISLGKALFSIVNSNKRNADYSRNNQ